MTAYVIGEVEVTKPTELGDYGKMVAAAVEKFGGRYLARGAASHVLEGGPAHKFLLIEFESVETAQRWYASPEYQAAKAVRQGKSNLRLLVIEGGSVGH
jgi:uncharacterized protein (DUF1330 family)